jgi:hypothetical protein
VIASEFADPNVWMSAVALLVSIVSVFLSWRSGRNAARALAISEGQEKRRQPQLGVYLARGYRRLTPTRQLFGFLVSVSNPTDINNSVARAELQLTFLLKSDARTVCRISHDSTPVETVSAVTEARATVFLLPLRVDAHQTESGWFFFAVENDVIGDSTVDGHCLILEDTHGFSTNTGPIMVRGWDEIQKS